MQGALPVPHGLGASSYNPALLPLDTGSQTTRLSGRFSEHVRFKHYLMSSHSGMVSASRGPVSIPGAVRPAAVVVVLLDVCCVPACANTGCSFLPCLPVFTESVITASSL